ncbi:MAG: peptidoglycan-associated lipoprotein [candidate division Zixibacteria bacterium 4484_93]|nr:MAG: peptidoglycan-associated lipoprotein [candidate division Zixibacteria bacterium 4484_93]
MLKKSHLPILFLVILLVFAGCGKKTAPPPEIVEVTPQVEEPVVEPEPEPEPEPELVFPTVYFHFDKYDIVDSSRVALASVAEQLIAHPDVNIIVEGHCDERGTEQYNLALGQKRAQSVKDFLVSYGIEATRIDLISYGEERPADPRHNEEAWGKNRRAELKVKK